MLRYDRRTRVQNGPAARMDSHSHHCDVQHPQYRNLEHSGLVLAEGGARGYRSRAVFFIRNRPQQARCFTGIACANRTRNYDNQGQSKMLSRLYLHLACTVTTMVTNWSGRSESRECRRSSALPCRPGTWLADGHHKDTYRRSSRNQSSERASQVQMSERVVPTI